MSQPLVITAAHDEPGCGTSAEAAGYLRRAIATREGGFVIWALLARADSGPSPIAGLAREG
jgi:hypothetical protein